LNAKRLWLGFGTVVFLSFAVLLYYGREIYLKAPPIPAQVITQDGVTLMTNEEIIRGQQVWQSIGGQEVGSVWGHGAYVAPDWTADWLHRESVFLLNLWSQREHQKNFDDLNVEEKAVLQARLTDQLKKNTLDSEGNITVSSDRALAIQNVGEHYISLFTDDPELADLREAYAIPKNVIKDSQKLKPLLNFFFWSSWAAVTLRPGDDVTYTNNWPPEKLVGNEPSSSLIIWTGFSVILLLLGIGLLAWYYVQEE